jgi:hypothetical protein
MLGACGMYGKKKNVYRILIGKPKGQKHFEGLSIDGSIIVKRIQNECDRKRRGLDWFVSGYEHWAVVNMAMDFRVPKKADTFLTR